MSSKNQVLTASKKTNQIDQKMSRIITDSLTRREERRKESEKSSRNIVSKGKSLNAKQSFKRAMINPDSTSSYSKYSQKSTISQVQNSNVDFSASENYSSNATNTKETGSQVRKRSKVVNYIERNKVGVEELNKRLVTSKKNQENSSKLCTLKTSQTIDQPDQPRGINAKLSIGIQRSKSQLGKGKKKLEVKPKFNLEASPSERLYDDLKRNVTDEQKLEIKDKVFSKYAELEQELQTNIGGRYAKAFFESQNSPQKTNESTVQVIQAYKKQKSEKKEIAKPQILNEDLKIIESQVVQQLPEQQSIVESPKIYNMKKEINTQKSDKKVGKPKLKKQGTEKELRKSANRTPINQGRLLNQTVSFLQKRKSADRIQSYKVQKVEEPQRESCRIEKINKDAKIDTRCSSQSKKKVVVPRLDLKNGLSKSMEHKKFKSSTQSSNQKVNLYQKQKKDNFEYTEPAESKTIECKPQDYGELSIKSGSIKSSTNLFKDPQTKEDYLNFQIEDIWKEMEDLKRSKQAAQELFTKFQNNFYDKTASNLYNQHDCSPTKRLIQMKNSCTRYVNVEEGGRQSQQYQLSYTTCPERSFVVRPDNGEINYEKRNTQKLVDQIVNGEVERIQIYQSRKSSPKKKSDSMSSSPIKMKKDHVKRGEMVIKHIKYCRETSSIERCCKAGLKRVKGSNRKNETE